MSYIKDINLPTLIDKLSDANNIKISGNSKGNRVGTVIDKIVEKADNVTKAINQEVVNNSYSFKVGTGGEVNVSQDVQEGFSEIALKGVTYQNIVKNYEDSNFQLHQSTKGSNNIFTLKHGTNINSTYVRPLYGSHMYKLSTEYTIIVDIIENTCNQKLGISTINSLIKNFSSRDFANLTGQSKIKITTNSSYAPVNGTVLALDLYFGI